jgi:hypothetical protein
MQPVRSAIGLTVAFCLLATAARADTIGSAPARPTDTGAVAARLQAAGQTPQQAAETVSKLSADDLAYFNAHPQRVQMVGRQEVQNFWYETLLGGAFGLAGIGLLVAIILHNRDT